MLSLRLYNPFANRAKVLYVVTLSVASVVNVVNALYTLAALKAKRLFTPGVKWSPLSFVALTHTVSISCLTYMIQVDYDIEILSFPYNPSCRRCGLILLTFGYRNVRPGMALSCRFSFGGWTK